VIAIQGFAQTGYKPNCNLIRKWDDDYDAGQNSLWSSLIPKHSDDGLMHLTLLGFWAPSLI